MNPDTGAQLGSFLPQNQWGDDIWSNLLALTNDGTDVLLSTLDPWDQCLKWVDSSTGGTEGQFCPPFDQGLASATGLAITAAGDVIEAKDDLIVHVTADETFAITYQTSLTDIRGLTFVSANLFMADDGDNTIYKATVPSGVEISTSPRALAQRTVGTTTTAFILVDATPKDKVLLVDPSTGTLLSSYDAPDVDGQGLTYLGASLYYAGRDNDGRARIYELDPDTGAQLSSVYPRWDWGGEIFDEPRSMGNDGNNLLVVFGTDDCMQRIDPVTGDNQGRSCSQFFGQGIVGARGLDMSSDGSFFSARDMDVVQLVSIDPDLIEVGRWSPISTTDIEGLVFVDEVLYIADDTTDSVYSASKPSGITDDPQGLAYDGTNMYILVDGALTDHIVVVDPASGAVVADFEAPNRNSNAITFLATQSAPTLFVSAANEMPWGRQHLVYRISPSDGSQLAPPIEVFADDWVDGWYGLTNDGESLVLAPSQEGFVILLDPDTGNFEKRTDLYGSPFFGFDTMAYHGTREDFLGADGNEVFEINKDGRFLQSFITTLGQLKGAVVIGDNLYLADGQSRSIQAATIPSAPSTVGTSPKGMATDGTNLYLVVDGSPKDRILVLVAATGQVINSYDAPGDNVDGLAWHNGDVYAVTNEFHPFDGNRPPVIHKLASATGAVLDVFKIQAPWGGIVWDPIAGLASDGTYLYASRRDDPQWFRVDSASPGLPAAEFWAQGDFMWTYYVGSLEIAAAPGIPVTLLSSGWSDAGQVITRYELDSGVVTDQFNIGNRSIEGMAYIGPVLYLADAGSDTILTATLPDNIPELTTVGGYETALTVVADQVTGVSDPAAVFSLVRNAYMQTEITAPLDNFATTTAVIPIQGLISDPSVDSVTVGVVLPFTSLLEDDVSQGASPALWAADGLWHVDCSAFWPEPINSSEPCAWRYGQVNQPGYGQGVISQGSLTTKDPITVGPKTRLRFNTWYATEPPPDVDLKLVEVAVVSTDADGNDVVGEYEAIIQIVGFGFFGAPLPFDDEGVPLFRTHPSGPTSLK